MAEPVYIGIDTGGSKTELLAAAAEGLPLVRLDGPGANLQRAGAEKTADVLAGLIRRAVTACAERSIGGICAGVAGAGRPEDRHRLTQYLEAKLKPVLKAPLFVVHDGLIALEAAFEGGSGIMVIAGTGSVAFARTHANQVLRAGGWGALLGDEGSGYALGREGLRAVAAAFDGGPATQILNLLSTEFGIRRPEDLIRKVYREHWPIAEAAPLVLAAADEDDPEALRIIEEQTGLLARQVHRLAQRTAGAVTSRIALMGGLVQSARYRMQCTAALHRLLPGWPIVAPARRPVAGAWRLARQPSTFPDEA